MKTPQGSQMTPRRSERLRPLPRDETPEPTERVRGPRSMAKLKKAKIQFDHNKTAPAAINKPEEEESSTVKASDDPVTFDQSLKEDVPKTRKIRSRSRTRNSTKQDSSSSTEGSQLSKTSSLEQSAGVEADTTVIEVNEAAINNIPEIAVTEATFDTTLPQNNGAVVEEITSTIISTIVADTETSSASAVLPEIEPEIVVKKEIVSFTESNPTDLPMIPQDNLPSSDNAETPEGWNRIIKDAGEMTTDLNVTPQLMDESVISVQESPIVSQNPPRDSTFSPVVDTSIQDSRPTIIATPKSAETSTRAVALRTSTPYSRQTQTFEPAKNIGGTPKVSAASSRLLAKVLTPKVQLGKKEKLNMTLNKSILKSTRKRSMSVADADTFMQKRVMFNSPKVMEIDAIDEKMMASFFEEKENSIMVQPSTSTRRKRSLSTGTPAKKEVPQLRSKMPNFKAIHELQFKRMESIADHAQRKAIRAKQLSTPTRDEVKKPEPSTSKQIMENKAAKPHNASKIPTRSALVPSASTENLLKGGSRVLKRSLSVPHEEPPSKKLQIAAPYFNVTKKIAVVSGLPRTINGNAPIQFNANPSTSSSIAGKNRSKVEERREKNMSLFKSKSSRTDRRAQSVDILKGVRLNRRFELQMQHRRDVNQ